MRSRERERLRLSRLPLRSLLLGDGEGRRFGDGDERRRRRSGVGDRREEAITAFSLRSARAPARGVRERRVGLRARSKFGRSYKMNTKCKRICGREKGTVNFFQLFLVEMVKSSRNEMLINFFPFTCLDPLSLTSTIMIK